MSQGQTYHIRVKGHISDSWSTWFESMDIFREESGNTMLVGQLSDQTALHGVLIKIRDLGLMLLEVKYIPSLEKEK
jgi:hypothetical protein